MSGNADLISAVETLADLLEASYTYEEVTVKRWILGDGGRSGNCEICNDNADMGWIDMDDIFESVDGDVDEPPAHPNCTCSVEFKDTRKRVYD